MRLILKNNKKGVVGLTTGKKVLMIVMVLGIIAFTLLVVLQSISDTSVASTSGSGSTANETLTTVTELGENLSVADLPDVICTIGLVINGTGTIIPASNFTATNCNLAYSGGNSTTTGFNNSDWDVTYTNTFNRVQIINNNISGGVETFFTNATTWFSLLGIVVLILIIVIVIRAVNRTEDSKKSSGL